MPFENGRQRRNFRDALLSAFPRIIDFEQMLSFELNENLDEIATGDNHSEVVFKLIKWAESQGRLKELIKAASQYNPGNPYLREFCQQYSPTQLQEESAQQQSQPTPRTLSTTSRQIEEDDNFSSERRVDYKRLRDLLKAGKWKEADEETATVMLKTVCREKEVDLNDDDIEKFPCTDLRTIDQLWVKYSNGRFGFSVQKRIWESENRNAIKFSKRVGWYIKENDAGYGFLEYDELTFDLSSPKGHLPSGGDTFLPEMPHRLGALILYADNEKRRGYWFSRVETCRV